jgi:anthranilate phosphoribosyltransferase
MIAVMTDVTTEATGSIAGTTETEASTVIDVMIAEALAATDVMTVKGDSTEAGTTAVMTDAMIEEVSTAEMTETGVTIVEASTETDATTEEDTTEEDTTVTDVMIGEALTDLSDVVATNAGLLIEKEKVRDSWSTKKPV